MHAAALLADDDFIEVDPDDYAKMSLSDRRKLAVHTVRTNPVSCNETGRVHFRCSAGNWCIPAIAPVTLVS